MCCQAEFDWPDYNPYRGLLQGKEGCIFSLVFIYLLLLLAFFMTSTERRYYVLLDTLV